MDWVFSSEPIIGQLVIAIIGSFLATGVRFIINHYFPITLPPPPKWKRKDRWIPSMFILVLGFAAYCYPYYVKDIPVLLCLWGGFTLTYVYMWFAGVGKHEQKKDFEEAEKNLKKSKQTWEEGLRAFVKEKYKKIKPYIETVLIFIITYGIIVAILWRDTKFIKDRKKVYDFYVTNNGIVEVGLPIKIQPVGLMDTTRDGGAISFKIDPTVDRKIWFEFLSLPDCKYKVTDTIVVSSIGERQNISISD